MARLGIQIADALQYAHTQGTLHRDIKPANLIIDTQSVVWVADFGLAKALEHDPVSRSGEIVGTLAYMAPEQLQGRTDRRSDIYSLGLTLYELLWRWCRRNPVVASLSTTAAILLLLVALTASIGYARTSRALAGERTQRQRAEAATDVAVQVLDRIDERFAPPDLGTAMNPADPGFAGNWEVKPMLSEGAAAALEDLLVFYDRLAESGGEDAPYREKVALANRRVGDIRHHLAQFEQAAKAYERALEIYLQLDQSSVAKPHVVEVAAIYKELGMIAHRSGQPDQARQRLQQALATLQKASAAGVDAGPELRLQMNRMQQLLEWIEDIGPPPPREPGPRGPDKPPRGPPREELGPPPGPPGFEDAPPDAPPRPLGPPRKPRPGLSPKLPP